MMELEAENKRLRFEIMKLKDLIVSVVAESVEIKAFNPYGEIIKIST